MKRFYALGFFVGLGLLSYGVWRLYHPAAYMLLGFFIMFACLALNRSDG